MSSASRKDSHQHHRFLLGLFGNCALAAAFATSGSMAPDDLVRPVRAAESMPPGRYNVTTETGMPHLEENLRYSTTHETRCLAHQELAAAFPVLKQESLKGCRLDAEKRRDDVISYLLICEDGQGTTGEAVWQLAKHRITGTLHVKLGGKNMTFYQRVTAIPVGPC